jgi:AcrR family transcriptional regulator
MTETVPPTAAPGLAGRPKRADAARNYDKLLAAAADAFAQDGVAASLEDIARRAGVGIGTLYRNFPTRQALLEAVYIDEVEEISRKAYEHDDGDPWEALSAWLHEFVAFAVTKHALADAMLATIDQDHQVFAACRTAISAAGGTLLRRAQDAGVVRDDTDFTDVGRMIAGIANVPTADTEQVHRMVDLALDGLRYRG